MSHKPATPPAARPAPPMAAAAARPAAAGGVAAPQRPQAAQAETPEEEEEAYGTLEALQDWLREAPSWLASLVVNATVVLVLALFASPLKVQEEVHVVSAVTDIAEEVEELKQEEIQQVTVETENTTEQVVTAVPTAPVSDPVPDAQSVDNQLAAPAMVEVDPIGLDKAPATAVGKEFGVTGGRGLEGRGAGRSALVAQRGGTKESEEAVARALRWLAEHQNADGSWGMDHTTGLCKGRCPNPGSLKNGKLAGTGLALLPFLGAGMTHKKGEYQRNVQAGLYYLVQHMKPGPVQQTGDLNYDEGRMYGHGICSIALCEAYGMTQDRSLFAPAQAALNFIAYAQDPAGGGWRYSPKQAGDTSAVGWQIMALKSGHMGYLTVNPNVIKGATNFLNTVQSDSGAAYGYTDPGAGPALTAIGLLCRMHLGWKKDNPALERGVQTLAKMGPSKGNMYFNYYATQVMAHYEGEVWKKWNPQMRDYLVGTQSKDGHTTGSWYLDGGDHGAHSGGRLYVTAMATMVLEVYYRHLPIFRKQAAEDNFPD